MVKIRQTRQVPVFTLALLLFSALCIQAITSVYASDGTVQHFISYRDGMLAEDPMDTVWYELYPSYHGNWSVVGWLDNDGDAMLSYLDQLSMLNETTGVIRTFQVDFVTLGIHFTFALPLEGNGDAFSLDPGLPPGDPTFSLWSQTYPVKGRDFGIDVWMDNDADGIFSPSDQFAFTYFDDVSTAEARLDAVTTDVVVSESNPYGGNAEVSRYKNFQFFEMTPQQHPPGNASITRYRNLQFFEMTSGSVHPAGNASVSRYRNLQFFEMTPTELPSVTITSFTTTDQNANPKSSFTPGSTVLFKIIVSGSGTQNIPNALISVMAQDPNLTPIFLSYVYEDIEIGKQTTIYLGFQIPYDCMLGDYTAKVNLFTLLPSQGGEPISGGQAAAHFTLS